MSVKRIITLAVCLAVVCTCFFSCSSGSEAVDPSTMNIDGFINGHAKYILDDLADDLAFTEFAADCLAEKFCTCNMPGVFMKESGAETAKWQINKEVTKDGYSKNEDAFLYPTASGDNDPIFLVYTMDVDGVKNDFLIRVSQYGGVWKVDSVMRPTVDQLACVTNTYENAEWHTVMREGK